MIIDDSNIIIERLVPVLAELRNVKRVIKGNSYDEGKEILAEEKVDVAILDINLTGKSGIDLLKLIRQQSPSFYPITIMMTDNPSDNKKKICMELGADHFVDKFEGFEKILKIVGNSSQQKAKK